MVVVVSLVRLAVRELHAARPRAPLAWPRLDGGATPPLLWRTHVGPLRDTLRNNARGLRVMPLADDAAQRAFLQAHYPETVGGYDALPIAPTSGGTKTCVELSLTPGAALSHNCTCDSSLKNYTRKKQT